MPNHTEPTRCCDLVMKGGITSGVLYPPAIGRIAESYYLVGIGGTSAGAIAAVGTQIGELFVTSCAGLPSRPTACFSFVCSLPWYQRYLHQYSVSCNWYLLSPELWVFWLVGKVVNP